MDVIKRAEKYIAEFEERAKCGNDFTGPAYTFEEYGAYVIIKELYAHIRGGSTEKAVSSVYRRVSTNIRE